jgi:signal transduction histidine kinase
MRAISREGIQLELQVSALRGAESAGGMVPRVLLVEDDPGVRDARRMLLQAEGYGVEAVASPEEALEAARRAGSFDVLITDDPSATGALAQVLDSPLKGVIVTDERAGGMLAEALLQPLRQLLSPGAAVPIGPAAGRPVEADTAALIVHELRSSLAVISNVLESCRTGILSDRIPNAGEILSRQLRKMARMTDDLLEAQGHCRAGGPRRCEPVSLTRVVIEAVQDLDPEIRRRDQSLILELPRDAIRVRGDALRLGQIVANIVQNASKYSGAGDRISISLRHTGGLAVKAAAWAWRSPGASSSCTAARSRRRAPDQARAASSRYASRRCRKRLERAAPGPARHSRSYAEDPAGGSTGIPDMLSIQAR